MERPPCRVLYTTYKVPHIKKAPSASRLLHCVSQVYSTAKDPEANGEIISPSRNGCLAYRTCVGEQALPLSSLVIMRLSPYSGSA